MPTLRQTKLAEALIQNMKQPISASAGELLVKVGYSESVATTKPGEIISSIGVQEILAKYLPDDELAGIHAKLLRKKEFIKDEYGKMTGQPHSDVKGALDMAYKLKGAYAAEKHLTAVITTTGVTNEDEEAIANEYEEKLKTKMLSEQYEKEN